MPLSRGFAPARPNTTALRAWRSCVGLSALVLGLSCLGASVAAAAPVEPAAAVALPAAATEPRADSPLELEAGVLVAHPAALATGQSLGAALGVVSTGWLAWGAVTSLSQASESSASHAVDHLEWRARAVGRLELRLGRGSFEVRAAVGATLVSETRLRHQSGRLAGDVQTESAVSVLPAAEVLAGARLRVFEGWGLGLELGPSWHLQVSDMAAKTGFSATVGVVRWL